MTRSAGKAADRPIYKRVSDEIADQIARGELEPETRLPSERELSDRLSISRMTARQVYVKLERDGLVHRSDRSGWFVAKPRLQYALMRSVSFVSNVMAEGGAPGARVLDARTAVVPGQVRDALELSVRAKVHVIRRLLSIGRQPAMIETLYVSAKRFSGLLDHPLEGSILAIWNKHYGTTVGHVDATISGMVLPGEDAEILGVREGAPGIRMVQTMFDTDKRPLAVDRQDWRHDIAEFAVSVDFD